MAFALHQHRAKEKAASADTDGVSSGVSRANLSLEEWRSNMDKLHNQAAQSESELNAKLRSTNVQLLNQQHGLGGRAKLYNGVERDIANMGQNATFGDVMGLLRRGPMPSVAGRTAQEQRQTAADVLQGIRTLKSMVDRENADVGSVANLLKHLMSGGGGGGGGGGSALPEVVRADKEELALPENGFAHRVKTKRLERDPSKMTRNEDDGGAFGVPDGACIRSKGCSERWTAKRQPAAEKVDSDDSDVAAATLAASPAKKGTEDLHTSINCLAVQQTKDRAHAIIGLGCGDVRVVDLGSIRTVPDPEKFETKITLASKAEPLLLQGHAGYVSSAIGVGQLAFTGSLDGTIRGWKYASSEEVVKSSGHQSAVHDLCYSPSRRCVYSASSDGTVRAWDLAGGKSKVLCEHFDAPCFSITINEKRGQLYVGLDSGAIGVVDAGSGAVISELKAHQSMVSSLDFSKEADLLASGSSDGTCRIFFAGTSIVQYTKHECPVYAVTLLQNATIVASGGSDGSVHCWSSSSGLCQTVYRHYAQETIFALVSGYAGTLLVGGKDGTLRCWEPKSECEFCRVRCSNVGANGGGCDWEFIQCSNECGVQCYRHEMSTHVTNCTKRRLRCTNPGCRDVMQFDELEKHKNETCPCSRVRCPNAKVNGGWGCTLQLRRRNIAEHMLTCKDPSVVEVVKKMEKEEKKEEEKPPASPGMKGRRAKQDLPTMKGGPTGKGVRVRIPLRSSAAARKLRSGKNR